MTELRSSNVLDTEHTIDSEILFKGERFVVPSSLQQAELNEFHYIYMGIHNQDEATGENIRILVFNRQGLRTTLHRVHNDYAGSYHAINAKSKWAEVGVWSSAPTSTSTSIIEMLPSIFVRKRYPDVMVSDNATIFRSDEFKKFCPNRGIFQATIVHGHPAPNSLVKRNLQTLKKRLAAMSDDPPPILKKIEQIVFQYRAKPLQNAKSLSELEKTD
uniref:Integrase catalytic domain-containing protein n=1 Tax=Glossina pallidipes TaxID=7398 RepID=A0A1A9ZW19_GLOPL